MAALVNLPFANVFTFRRAEQADYRDASGQIITAALDEARFDHDGSGQRIGLLLSAGNQHHDQINVRPGDWEVQGKATIMFEYEDAAGLHRRALYSQNVRASIDAILTIAGHHRSIGAVAGFLPNLGGEFAGFVKYANRNWQLGRPLVLADGTYLTDGQGRIMIESA